MILEQQFPLVINLLLKWSKGYIGEEVETRQFLIDLCITGLKIIPEAEAVDTFEKVLLEEKEEQNLYLVLERKGGLQIIDLQFTIEEIEGYENLGKFTKNGEIWNILIKKGQENPKNQFLVNINENLDWEYKSYYDLLGNEIKENKKSRELLKEELCKAAWAAYKFLIFNTIGKVSQTDFPDKQAVKDLFMHAIFSELQWDQSLLESSSSWIKIGDVVSGKLWINKINVGKKYKKNPMQEWIRQFIKETECLKESILKEMIMDLVTKADPAMKGVLTPAEISRLDPEFISILSQDAYKNYQGNFDFFKYINTIHEIKTLLTKEDLAYMENSKLWTQIPEDYEQASLSYDFCNIEAIYRNVLSRFSLGHHEKSFSPFLSLFGQAEIKGIVKGQDCPSDFKNEEGDLDFYVTMHAIAKDQAKYRDYYNELKEALLQYDDLPISCSEICKESKSSNEYMTSLLWTIYGCLDSNSILSILAREEYIEKLIKITFLNSIKINFTLGSRILKAIISTQYSPQTLFPVFSKIPYFYTENTDFIQFLLERIGKMAYWYGLRSPKTDLFRIGYEAIVFLKELINSDKWKNEVFSTIIKFLSNAIENLKEGKALLMHQVGAIKSLPILTEQLDIFRSDPIELAEVRLEGCNIERCIIREDNRDSINIYSPITDEKGSWAISSIASLIPINNFRIKKSLNQDELQIIYDSAINLWFLLADSEFSHLKIKSERVASFRILYAHLEDITVNAISFIVKNKQIKIDECTDLLRLIINHAKVETKIMGKQGEQLLIKEIIKKIAEESIYNELADEEIMEIFSYSNDVTKGLIEELKQENVEMMIIAKCLKMGIKDKSKILDLARKPKDLKSNLLFRLQKIDPLALEIIDTDGHADIYQNSNNQFLIENNHFSISRKQITTIPDISVFQNATLFVENLTILARLEGLSQQNQLSFGLKLGGIDIGLSTKSGSPSFEINGRVITSAKLDEILALRIYLNPNGHIKIIHENTKESFDLEDTTIFNGFQIGAYGLYMEAGTKASLLTFEVYEGNNPTVQPANNDPVKTDKALNAIRSYGNSDKLGLKLLGLNDDQFAEALSSGRDLRSSLDYISQNFPWAFQNGISSLNQDVVTEIKLAKTINEVPLGFSPVPIYEEGKKIEFKLPKLMILCIKKEPITTGNAFTNIEIGSGAEGYIDLGSFESQIESAHIWVKPGEVSKAACIKDIIIIKSSSIYKVKIPLGYSIIKDKERNDINIGQSLGEKSYLFMAVKLHDSILNCPLVPFMNMQLPARLGQIETPENWEDIESDSFKSKSIQELFSYYFKYIDYSKQSSYKNLALVLMKNCPNSLGKIAEEFSIIKLLDFLGVNKISKIIDNLLSEDNPKLKDKLLKDCLVKLLKRSSHREKLINPLPSLTIESSHPYENQIDLDKEIRIPGAKALYFVFDSQCKTENDYDYLAFYRNPGRQGEIASFSGDRYNWHPFCIEGDTVYIYFHADGSNNDWGYKFEVIPTDPGAATEEKPLSEIWMLNKISNLSPIPAEFMAITSPQMIQPIFSYSLAEDIGLSKLALVNIMSKIIKDQKGLLFKNIVNILMTQANELHSIVSINKAQNSLLQATARFLEDASCKFSISNKEVWFIDYCELASDIKQLSEMDELFDTFLFESFKKTVNWSLGRTYESKHPYVRKTKKELIQIPGASSISIVFDSNSALDPRDTAFFSYDEFGKKLVEEKKIEATLSAARWKIEPCGNKVIFANGASQVTRKKKSGWGCAIWSEDYSDGSVRINFNIDSDGYSDYLYIGAYKTERNTDNYDLDEYIGCDCPTNVWSWKKTGEFHKKDWSKDGFEGFKSGDQISMFINMDLRELIFIKGNQEVFKFTGIALSVTPVVCFGALNQVVTVTSVERMPGLRPLCERNLNILGDSFYYRIPVHRWSNVQHFWESNQKGADLCLNKIKLVKSTNDKTYHETEAEMRDGKYYFEVIVETKGFVGVGFTKKSLINKIDIEGDPQTMIYYSSGKIHNDKIEHYGLNDMLGCYIDFDRSEIAFYKNNKLLQKTQISLYLEDLDDCFKFLAVLSEKDQCISLRNIDNYPEGVELLEVELEQETDRWGYKFALTPTFKGRDLKIIESYLSFASANDQENWRESYRPTYLKLFKDGIVLKFTEFMDNYLHDKNIRFFENLLGKPLELTNENLALYPELQKLSANELFNLKEMLLDFNVRFEKYFYLFDLKYEPENSLMKFIKNTKHYVLYKVKYEKLYNFIESTHTRCRTKFIIDKEKAQDLKAKGEIDQHSNASIFSQISNSLLWTTNKSLRHEKRMFMFGYKGQEIQDEKDKYEELLIEISKELQSPLLPLLIPSQNSILNVGNGRDNWIINPSSTLPIHIQQFNTLGKFFGSIIRARCFKLNLSLPLIIFKHLLHENITAEDLRDFDFPTYQILHKLRNPGAYGITPENFREKFTSKFDEKASWICEDEITYENANKYADLLEKQKLFENPKAYDAIRKGMAAVIPIDLLNLFTAAQLRNIICEDQEIKIEILDENTIYENWVELISMLNSFGK